MKPLIVAIILLCLQAHAIVGGRLVGTSSHFARQVAFIYSPEPGSTKFTMCTGTFIDRWTVLTAAHCVPEPGRVVNVVFGTKVNPTFSTQVVRVLIHRSYDPDSEEGVDLAVMRVRNPLPSGFFVTPLAQAAPIKNSVVGAAGFGITAYFNLWPGDVPQLRYVQLATQASSALHWPWTIDGHIVAPIGDHGGISSGDSGGPLFMIEDRVVRQVGVACQIFFKPHQTLAADHAMWTSVPANRDWILSAAHTLAPRGAY